MAGIDCTMVEKLETVEISRVYNASPTTFDQLKAGKVDRPIALLIGAIRLEGATGRELAQNEIKLVLLTLPACPVTNIL